MTTHILVAGLINIETTVKVDAFPIPYQPQRFPFFGVQNSVSGVGYNVSKALTTLGNHVSLLALVGNDMNSQLVRAALQRDEIDDRLVEATLPQTPQSAILYDPAGRRAIFTDLKDIQERSYPAAEAAAAIANGRLLRALQHQFRTAPAGGGWRGRQTHCHRRARHRRAGRLVQRRLHGGGPRALHEPRTAAGAA